MNLVSMEKYNISFNYEGDERRGTFETGEMERGGGGQ